MSHECFETPLASRYASPEMSFLFSAQNKHSSWRKLWTILAEAQKELGLNISEEQLDEMRSHVHDIDFARAEEIEKEVQHDVMAHIHTFGEACPTARPIIHLGATSCFVTDNTEVLQMRDAFLLIITKLTRAIEQLSNFALSYADVACLGYTHFQPAQLTTVGKRACLWIQDLLLDFEEVKYRMDNLCFLGAKGTIGTQASFLALLGNDESKVQALDKRIAAKMGFHRLFTISGQTYTRKQDIQVLASLAGIGASAHKFATDLRLLAHLKEVEEPFSKKQVGSSAMPYKRNPILSERICGLSRFLISLAENPYYTAATQWMERSLDDSSNRRLAIPEAFLACDSILELLIKISSSLTVHPAVISRHIEEELPFMAVENILMACTLKGGNRQHFHEKLRVHSHQAASRVKERDGVNDLLERIQSDAEFQLSNEKIQELLSVDNFVGRAPQQVRDFIQNEVQPSIKGAS